MGIFVDVTMGPWDGRGVQLKVKWMHKQSIADRLRQPFPISFPILEKKITCVVENVIC